MGYTLGAWWFEVSHLPGSILRRMLRPIYKALNPSPGTAMPWWAGMLIISLVFVAFTGVGALVLLKPKVVTSPQGVNHTAVGQSLGEWRLASLNQQGAFATEEQAEGKVVVVHFWRLGHKDAQATLPKIAQIHQRNRGSNQFITLAVVSAAPTSADTEAESDVEQQRKALRRKSMDLLSERNIDLPVYDDIDGSLAKTAETIGAFQGKFPTTIVLDKGGKVQGVWNQYPPGQLEQISTLVQHLITK